MGYGYTKSTVKAVGPDYTGGLEVGDDIPGNPAHKLSGQLAVTAPTGTTVTLSGYRYGSRRDVDFYGFLLDLYSGVFDKEFPNDYFIPYPAYTRLNLGVTQDVSRRLAFYVRVANLTDDDTFEADNFLPARPRTFTFGVRLTNVDL